MGRTILAIAVIIVLVIATARLFGNLGGGPANGSASTTAIVYGPDDLGQTVAVEEGSRFGLELPQDRYLENTLALAPAGVIGQTFGADPSSQSNWIRTFEGVRPGTTTLTVLPVATGTPSYVLNIQVIPAD